MELTQKAIVTLLKCAVTGEKQALPDGFALESAEELIRKQGLGALVYEGASLCGVSPQEPIMQKLFGQYYRSVVVSERQMRKVKQIFAAFEEKGIEYLPFKGCVMKALYPKPELRPMSDADILIRFAQYETIKPIMEELGFELKTESDCELIWQCKDLYLELHKCLVQPSHRDYYPYFGDGWGRAKHIEGFRCGFTPEDTYVYLFMHFAKHYRAGGISCRHVVDLWVYRRQNPNLDEDYIAAELKKLKLETFHDHTCRLLDAWFDDGELDDVTRFIHKRIFSGGVWGNSRDYYVFAELTKQKNATKVHNSKMGYFLRLAFPSLKLMQDKYPVLKKCPVLLPIYWVVRGVAVLLHKREKIGASMRVAGMVSNEALMEHQDALRYVGLEFCPDDLED